LLEDREVQRALMQYFKPENWFVVHKALVEAGRKDLIGDGPLSLIPSQPPKQALAARRAPRGRQPRRRPDLRARQGRRRALARGAFARRQAAPALIRRPGGQGEAAVDREVSG
jgi:hypothetical protein